MSINRERDIPKEVVSADEQTMRDMGTVDTVALVDSLQVIGMQLGKVVKFQELRQTDAQKNKGNSMFHQTDQGDEGAAEGDWVSWKPHDATDMLLRSVWDIDCDEDVGAAP